MSETAANTPPQGVIHTLMHHYRELNRQSKIFTMTDIGGTLSGFHHLHGGWETFWNMGNWGQVIALAAPHDEECDFRANSRKLVVIMGR
jgi:hypothetical protein